MRFKTDWASLHGEAYFRNFTVFARSKFVQIHLTSNMLNSSCIACILGLGKLPRKFTKLNMKGCNPDRKRTRNGDAESVSVDPQIDIYFCQYL